MMYIPLKEIVKSRGPLQGEFDFFLRLVHWFREAEDPAICTPAEINSKGGGMQIVKQMTCGGGNSIVDSECKYEQNCTIAS
ncbi:hypothetical protein SESBI_10349 [Sesbania bispinosa]|nr:hypothetical protein SESBI_10349 [Sesbania bispinosa]